MDFVERWFHISPDGGNGTFEVAIVVAVVVMAACVVFRKRIAGAARQFLSRHFN